MTRPGLDETLREAAVPESPAARERAWQAASAAYAARPARRRMPIAPFVVAAVAAAAALAATPPGDAVADWVKDIVAPPERPATPQVRTVSSNLPAGGRVLAVSPDGAWIVDRRHRRPLGRWSGASWSPQGRFVAAWRGRTLAAVDPAGVVRWQVRAPAAVQQARWSPEGFHVAYVSAGRLRVVSGLGSGDTAVRDVPAVTAVLAFRPGALRTLAYATARGGVEVRELFTGQLVWRSPRGLRAVRGLEWSADGRTLLALGARRLWWVDVHAGRVRSRALPHGYTATALAAAPAGRRLAVLLASEGGGADVRLAASPRAPLRPALTVPSALRDPVFSPDGRWLAAVWSDADQWLFVPVRQAGVTASSGLGRRFGGTPRIEGWCCPASR